MEHTYGTPTEQALDLMCNNDTLLVRAEDGNIYRIQKMLDDDPVDPRNDVDNLGTMVSWHEQYTGDETPEEKPHNWLAKLLCSNISDVQEAQLVYKALYSGECETHRLIYDDGKLKLCEYEDGKLIDTDAALDPHCFESYKFPEWFLNDCCNALTVDEILGALEKMDFVFLPLYLCNDSDGHSISTSDLGDPRRVSQIGWIYTNRDKCEKWFHGNRDKEAALRRLESEVVSYDYFVFENIHGIVITRFDAFKHDLPEDAGENEFTYIDSHWDFYSAKDMDNYVREIIGDYKIYEGEAHGKYTKELPPIEEAGFKCVFCGGTVTGRYFGRRKEFSGRCQNCGAEYHQPPKAAPRG